MAKKRVLLAVLSCMFAVLLFIGCTPTGSTSKGKGNNKTANVDVDTYPNKPIQLIVPVKAGGDTDTNARIFAKYLAEELGQSVVVVNTEGGSGATGTKAVMDANPDGLTVLFFHTESLLPKLSGMVDYDLFDLKMCGIMLTDNTTVLATHKDSGFKTMDEFVKKSKDKPGSMQFGMATGGYPHLIGLAIEDVAGVDMNVVDVGGNADKTTALLGHKIELVNTQYGLTKDYFSNGDFVCLGVTSEERNPLLKDVPTMKEQGYDLVFNKAFFTAMPQNTSDDIRDKFSEAMENVCKNKKYIAEMEKFFIEVNYMNPGDSTKYMEDVLDTFTPYADGLKANV